MTARDELFDAAAHSAATSSEDPEREARQMIDAFRAEVLREAADAMAAQRYEDGANLLRAMANAA